MYLSKHFTLEELCVTSHKSIDNTPTPAVMENLQLMANALEVIRMLLGKPMLITSCYRSPALNKLIGGSPKSRHMLGLAADFLCPQYGSPFHVACLIRDSDIPFDQLIYERPTPARQWVHFGLPIGTQDRRSQVMTMIEQGKYIEGIVA